MKDDERLLYVLYILIYTYHMFVCISICYIYMTASGGESEDGGAL